MTLFSYEVDLQSDHFNVANVVGRLQGLKRAWQDYAHALCNEKCGCAMKDGRRKRAAIHARVTTDGQTTDNQLRELRLVAEQNGWQIVQEFLDQGISGAKGREHRPAFDALWKGAVRREFAVIMAWAVDLLGRPLSHLVNFLSRSTRHK